MADSFTGAVPS